MVFLWREEGVDSNSGNVAIPSNGFKVIPQLILLVSAKLISVLTFKLRELSSIELLKTH